ncbi:MAG: penicillin acylase family protein [Pirellulaceae bacterium]
MLHDRRIQRWQCRVVSRLLTMVLLGGIASSPALADAGEVEMLRDTWGIPHVFAAAEEDGFFGLGYAAAEDRLLQMELVRRKAAGRLAEVFGRDWVDADREARIAGHAEYAPRALANLPERWQRALGAYAAGVNAWRHAHPDAVARRFQPLGISPDPWTPADCLLAARGILSLGSPFSVAAVEGYYRFHELVAQVGEAEAALQSSISIDDSVAVVSESEMAKDEASYARLKQRPRMPGFELRSVDGQTEPRRMSHAWAVSGRRSTTGRPILENDPQLTLSSPPFFYEFHLASGNIDARGLGIPGCPGLFVGFNRHVAWGGSALGVDSHVIFLERLTPDGKNYLFENQALPFERRLERIEVKGGQPVIQEVLTNRHGTVFNSLVPPARAGDAYVCYDAQTMDAGACARMMLEVLDAGNWTEFRHALDHYYYPGLHVVYADAEGNVGYHTLVHRPLTTRSPRHALEGWTGRDEVNGRIPLNELPHMLNPDAGYVSHANNLPVGSWYPYDLGLSTGGTGDTSRSWRLRQLLDGDRKLKFSLDDFEHVLHRDDVNPIVAALLPVARKVVEEDKIRDAAVLGLLESTKDWNLHDGTTDQYPAAGRLRNTLTPYRGSGLQNVYGAGGGGIARLAREVGSQFAEDGSTPKNALVRTYLVNWLQASATGGGRGAGNASPAGVSPRPPAAENSDRFITIPYQRTIPHNLPVVDASLDLVSPPLTCLDQGTIWSQPGNVYTQIVDLSDVDNSRSMIAPGNAEDSAGGFRANQIDIWVQGTTHAAPLSRQKIESLVATQVTLSANAYDGPLASPQRTVSEIDSASRFVAAIPPVAANAATRPQLPGRKPEDPTLEAAFRFVLRNEGTPAEIDDRFAEVQKYVQGKPALQLQLGEALKLGVYLTEESLAGRLRVRYGSPYCLKRMRDLLQTLEPTGRRGSDAER